MMLYPSLCYLHNHKTGSTLVETFLRKFCAEELLVYRKHAAPSTRPGRFCFTNVREPLALYRSLFAYGLDGRGTVFQRLAHFGHGHFYSAGVAGFEPWLDFVLRPENARLLDDAYPPALARAFGLMTWRFLRLACPGLESWARTASGDREALRAHVRSTYCLDAVLRQEALLAGLAALVRGPLTAVIADRDEALAWLASAPRVNASSSDALAGLALAEEQSALLGRRERFLYQNFFPSGPSAGSRPGEAGSAP